MSTIGTFLYTFNRSIKDIIQLNAFLEDRLGTSFKYVNYFPKLQKITVVAVLGNYASETVLRKAVSDAMTAYTDPTSPETGGTQIGTSVRLDAMETYSKPAISSKSELNMTTHRITNLASPTASTDAANRAYVDAISAGSALSKNPTGPTFNVRYNTSLYVDASNNLGISSGALGTGLAGGNGTVLSVIPNQSQITRVGTLLDLTVNGLVKALSGLDANGSKIINVANPTLDSDAANRGYVNSTINLAAGNGLSSVGTLLSVNVDNDSINIIDDTLRVNSNQPRVTSLGTLTSLTVNGPINVNNNTINNVAPPIGALDAANRQYVDSMMSAPGKGISKTGATIDANVDNFSLEISPTNFIRIANANLGTGLAGGSGARITVISDQSQVTRVGPLEGLTVSGLAVVTDTTDTVGSLSGALQVMGGTYIGKDLFIEGSETVRTLSIAETCTIYGTTSIVDTTDSLGVNSGSIVVHGGMYVGKTLQVAGSLNMNDQHITNLATPTSALQASNKQYVDSLVVSAGRGLLKTGNIVDIMVDNLSIEIDEDNNVLRVASSIAGTGLAGGSGIPLTVVPDQPQITAVGLLTSLAVNGPIEAYSGMNANNTRITSVAAPIYGSDAVNRDFVDSTRPTPGSGLIVSASGTDFNVNVDAFSIEVDAANVVRLSSGGLGTGLTGGSGSLVSVVPELTHVVRVGTLLDLSVNGAVSFNNTSDATSATSGPINLSGGMSVSKSGYFGGPLHALASLNVLHTATFNSPATLLSTEESEAPISGCLVASGGVGIAKSLSVGGHIRLPEDVNISADATALHVSKPDYDLTLSMETGAIAGYNTSLHLFNLGTENGVDAEYLEIAATPGGTSITTRAKGTGEVRPVSIGSFLSVDASRGIIRCDGTQDSVSYDTGALIVSNGGLGVAGSVYLGSTLHVAAGIDANGSLISNVASPVNPFDAVNRAYLESVVQGLSIKGSVRAASIGPVTLTSVVPGFALDDAILAADDRVLLKNQTDPLENGIWVVTATGNPIRSEDMNAGSNANGAFVFVESGTVNNASGWVNSTPGATDIVGTDPLVFTQFSGAGEIVAGLAMTKTGNRLDINVDNVSVEVFGNALRIASGAVGSGLSGGSGIPISVNANIPHVTGLGIVTSGTWNADIVTVPFGGTGVNAFPVNEILYGNGDAPVSTSNDFTFANARLSVPTVFVSATSASISASTGALVVRGGAGISGNLYVNGNTSFAGTVTVRDPVNPSDASHKGYVDSIISTPGTGLTKVGTMLSVNAAQPQITSVGVLTGLNSTGPIQISNSTESTSVSTGSLVTSGGIGVSGSVNIGLNLAVAKNATFSGTITVPNPQSAMEAATRYYVDSVIPMAGSGLTKAGNVFFVNAHQPGIVSVGTLESLHVAGRTHLSDTTDSTGSTSGALVVDGGIGIGKGLQVAGLTGLQSNLSVGGIFNVSNVAQSTSVTTGSVIVAGGMGLAGNLNTSGIVTLFNGTQSSSPTTGALVVYGGVGVSGNLMVSGSVNVPPPTDATNAVNLAYLHANLATAGTGLTKTGTVFSINTAQPQISTLGTLTSLDVAGQTNFRNTSPSTSGTTGSVVVHGGLGLLGNLYSENKIETAGQLSVINTTPSNSITTGSVVIAGGLGLAGNAYVGAEFNVAGASSFAGPVTVPVPTNATHAGRKDYIDGLSYLTAGTGLTKSGSTLFINSSQTHITTVGTLTELVSSGVATITNTTAASSSITGALVVLGGVGINGSVYVGTDLNVAGLCTFTNTVTVPTPLNDTDAGRKDYIDGLTYLKVGAGLTKTGSTLSINAYQPQIITLGTLTNLNVSGTSNFAGAVTVPTPWNPTDAVNKDYCDAVIQGLSIKYSVIASSTEPVDLTLFAADDTLDGVVLAQGNRILLKDQLDPVENGIYIVGASAPLVRSTDFTIGSDASRAFVFVESGDINISSGWVVITTENQNVIGTDPITFTRFSRPGQMMGPGPGIIQMANSFGVNVDGYSIEIANDIVRVSSAAIGTGLSGGSGAAISVNSAQPTITSLGTLTGLSVSGPSSFTSIVATGAVTVPNPSAADHAVTKSYTDGLTYLTAGTGLTKTSGTLSVNASQPQITSVGTLTGLVSSGTVSITNTTVSSSTTSGALVISGGMGVSGASYFGGTSNFATNVSVGSNLVYSANNMFVTSATSSSMSVLRVRNPDVTNTGVGLSVGNISTTSNYTSRLELFTLNVSENSANTEQLTVEAGVAGGSIYWKTAGTGATRPLTIYGNTVFNTNGTVGITSTMDTTSVDSGALILGGGLGVSKSVFVGNNLYVGSSSVYMMSDTTAGFGIRLRNTNATNTETRFSLSNSGATTTYTSRLQLFALGTSEVANQEYLDLASGPSGASLRWVTAGTGTPRSLSIYNGAFGISSNGSTVSVGSGSILSVTSTVDSVSNITGAMILSGGLGVAKNISSASATIANVNILPFQTTASWINMPTTGSSGIGSGGAGANAWLAYAATAGTWFSNSAAGDICYRNTGGKLLFGNTSGAASMALAGDNLGIGTIAPGVKLDVVGNARVNGVLINVNTTDSTSAVTGSAIFSGGIGVAKTVSAGMGVRLMDAGSGSVVLSAPPAVTTNYTMRMPAAPPSTNGQFLMANTTGALYFNPPVPPAVATVYDATVVRVNTIIYTVTGTTDGGQVIVYPTTTGTLAGAALFTKILSATASAVVNTTSAIQVAFCGLNSISADLRTVIFNVVTGASAANKEPTLMFAANGVSVQVTIIGL